MRINHVRNLQTSSYRRCLRVTLLFFVIQLFAVSQLRAEDKIVVQTLKVVPGTKQKLAIQLNNKEEYTAFQVEIFLPEGITPVKTDKGDYSVSLSSSRTNDHTITANVVSSGALKVAAYSPSNESLKGTSGDLFYVDIISDATFEGSAKIEVKEILFTRSSDRKEVAFADASGVAESGSGGIKGDANGDGTVNAADIVEVVNYIMGNPSGKFKIDGANANGDEAVNAADIVTIVNMIMGN